jgi:antitoxin YefM
MVATNYTNARQNLRRYCDEAVQNCETVVITRKNDENVVLMSEAEYNNLMENLFIRRDAEEYRALVKSSDDLLSGKDRGVTMTMEEFEAYGDE